MLMFLNTLFYIYFDFTFDFYEYYLYMFIFYIFLLYSFICYNLGKIKNGKNVPNPLINIFIRLLKLDGVKSYSTFPFLSCKITVLYNEYVSVVNIFTIRQYIFFYRCHRVFARPGSVNNAIIPISGLSIALFLKQTTFSYLFTKCGGDNISKHEFFHSFFRN